MNILKSTTKISKNGRSHFESCALILQKQLSDNETRAYCLHIHCALSATSKVNLKPLFDFIKNFSV
jgi:hypothetical protein